MLKGGEQENRIFSKRKGFISQNQQNHWKSEEEKGHMDIVILKIKNSQYCMIHLRYEKSELKNVQIIEREPITNEEYR